MEAMRIRVNDCLKLARFKYMTVSIYVALTTTMLILYLGTIALLNGLNPKVAKYTILTVLGLGLITCFAAFTINLVWMCFVVARCEVISRDVKRGKKNHIDYAKYTILPAYLKILRYSIWFFFFDFLSVGTLYSAVAADLGVLDDIDGAGQLRDFSFGVVCPAVLQAKEGKILAMVMSLVTSTTTYLRIHMFVYVMFIFMEKSLSKKGLRKAMMKSFLTVTPIVTIIGIFVDRRCFATLFNWDADSWILTSNAYGIIGLLVEVAFMALGLYLGVRVRKGARRWVMWLTWWFMAAFPAYMMLGDVAQRDVDLNNSDGQVVAGPVGFIFWMTVQAFCAPVLYSTLRADTRFWRGCGNSLIPLSLRGEEKLSALQESLLTVNDDLQKALDESHSTVIDFSILEVEEQIASGATAKVFAGKLLRKPVAIKVFTPPEILPEDVWAFAKEAALAHMVGSKNSNIVTYYGICVCPPDISLVFELCRRGSLDNVLRKGLGGLTWMEVDWPMKVGMMLDIAKAVQHLHSFNPPYVHRDIKSLNYLVTDDYRCKLTDFGESRRVRQVCERKKRFWNNDEVDQRTMTKGVGTLYWMAPEVLEGTNYTEKADVFSLTITLWEVLTGLMPFNEVSFFEVGRTIMEGGRPTLPGCDECDYPMEFPALLERGWAGDPQERCSASDIVAALTQMKKDADGMFSDVQSSSSSRMGKLSESTFGFSKSKHRDKALNTNSTLSSGNDTVMEVPEALTDDEKSPATIRRPASMHIIVQPGEEPAKNTSRASTCPSNKSHQRPKA